jgi:hypothetical protein
VSAPQKQQLDMGGVKQQQQKVKVGNILKIDKIRA